MDIIDNGTFFIRRKAFTLLVIELPFQKGILIIMDTSEGIYKKNIMLVRALNTLTYGLSCIMRYNFSHHFFY